MTETKTEGVAATDRAATEDDDALALTTTTTTPNDGGATLAHFISTHPFALLRRFVKGEEFFKG